MFIKTFILDHTLALHFFFFGLKNASLLAINTQGTTLLIVVFIALIFLSFLISGAEVAFFSLTYKDINLLRTKQQPYARRIITLLEDPKILMGALSAANTFFNVVIILGANFLIDSFLALNNSLWWVEILVKILIITTLILLFCQVLPRVYATQNNIRFAKFSSWWLDAIVVPIFRRIGQSMVQLGDSVESGLGHSNPTAYSLEQIDHAIDWNSDHETSQEEKNILKGIVKFSNITVKQIMRTRLDVSGIDYNLSLSDLIKRVEELHYSRLPVYKNNMDEVVGILNTKDLLPHLDNLEFDWHVLLRQPYFVHEHKLIDDLLKEFQQKRTHIAVVVDEFGGTSGIVTLEDILEEIIGDIKDEFDDEESVNKKIDDHNYIFEGKTKIHDVCQAMNLSLDTFDQVRGESDSLAGLVLELAGKFPSANELIPCGDFEFSALEIDRNRIQKVRVTIRPGSTE